jgi:hypothetical protein
MWILILLVAGMRITMTPEVPFKNKDECVMAGKEMHHDFICAPADDGEPV